ncbi:hypothetical protein V1478_009059 [Vespula squamosa]|uniref:Uncharacterized protein n=1 Tax=Vespula squamosa TaxID=30214 RepID=A0ABD2AVA2_VESSQ
MFYRFSQRDIQRRHFYKSWSRDRDTRSPVACINSKKKLKNVGWKQRTYIDDFHLEMQTKVAIHGHLVRSTTCNGPIRCQRRSERFRDENRFFFVVASTRRGKSCSKIVLERRAKIEIQRNIIVRMRQFSIYESSTVLYHSYGSTFREYKLRLVFGFVRELH